MSLFEVEDYLGMGHSARKAAVYSIHYDGVEGRTERQGDDVIHTFGTPLGEVSSRWSDPPDARARGVAPIQKDYYIQSARDFEIMEYVAARRRYTPDYDAYRQYDQTIGENGYPLVIIGPSPIGELMIKYLGYERFYHELTNSPGRVRSLLAVMEENARGMWDMVARSPAEFVLQGVHFSSEMTPPHIFREFFVNYFRRFNDLMHRAGKRVAFHADADLTALREQVLDCGFDVADCLATAPLVRCTFDQARAAWGARIVIWGGVPSIILEPEYPWHDFQDYIRTLHRKTAGRPGFIMAVSDQIMPRAQFDRLLWIRDFLGSQTGREI